MINTLSEMIKSFPFGLAYYQAIIVNGNEVEDLVLLDANRAFEEITGHENQFTLGKKVKQVCPEINMVKCIDYMGSSAVTGISREMDIVMSGNRYKATSFSPEYGFCVIIFQKLPLEQNEPAYIENRGQVFQKDDDALDFDAIFNSTQDAMFLVKYENGEFYYIKNNSIHQKQTGYSLKEVQGKTPVDIMGPKIGEVWRENYKKCIESGKSMIYEEALAFQENYGEWLVNLTPVINKGKKYIIGSRISMSELKSLRRDKDELLSRQQSMFAEHTAVMLLIEPITGMILNANPAACSFYGYEKDEILKLKIQDINVMPAEEVKRLRLRALTEKERYFIFPHRLKNGEIRLVDVYSSPITYGDRTELFSIIFDVTDREKYKEDLYREKKLLSITLDSIGDGVVTTDKEGMLSSLNKAAKEITGWNEDEAKARQFSEVFKLKNEYTGRDAENPVNSVLKSGKTVGLANHTVLLNKQGKLIPIEDSAAPIVDEKGDCYGVVMVFRDVSREKEQQKQILYLSYHDPLTRLFNRRFIEEEMLRIDTTANLPLAVIMGDVNGLKITNDIFGHLSGDKLLQKVAKIIEETCRSGDVAARWGGDEFIIFLPKTETASAYEMIQRLKKKFIENSANTMQISVSLGLAVKTKTEEELQYTLQKAEERMYRQKLLEGKSYRNNIVSALLATLYEKSMETEEHAERLRDYCHAAAEILKLSANEMNELSLLAMLHDIGKVGIQMDVLKKPGPLNDEEWDEMKRHPEIGYRIAQNTPELAAVSEYILSHHERWDGAGYPRGLRGEEIPLLCRILAVADAYDAMIYNRVYRKAISKPEAISELRLNRGTQFDPEITDIFLGLMENKSYDHIFGE